MKTEARAMAASLRIKYGNDGALQKAKDKYDDSLFMVVPTEYRKLWRDIVKILENKSVKITRDDLTIRRNANGIEIAAMVNGYRKSMQYVGYTRAQAIRQFLRDVNGELEQ